MIVEAKGDYLLLILLYEDELMVMDGVYRS